MSDILDTISHIIDLLVLSLSHVAQKTVIIFFIQSNHLIVSNTFSNASGVCA
ncbi:hypothetical protein HOF65_05535 [bacterium]|nr:hypothetical protein [bacterium]MBT4633149.1 hypothetical protein [bacterium]MBT6778910.1 hypothetical protein [bacterium]